MSDIRESNRLKPHILDEATRSRRQKKALEALEKDNFHDEVPTSGLHISDYRLQLNKKFQQRFTVEDDQNDNKDATTNPSCFVNNPTNQMESSNNDCRKKRQKQDSKLRFRKNFIALIDEEYALTSDKIYNYFNICVPPSKFPPRKFCSVCGFPSNYTCIQCGSKYCCTKCLQTHQDTRCLKWTA